MSNNGMYWLGVILITIGLSVLLTRKDNQYFDHNLNVDGSVLLNVKTSSGNIDISKRDGDKVEIRTDVKVRSFVPFEAGRITRRIKRNPPIEQNGNEIVIGDMSKYRFGPSFFRSISIDYDIETPFDSELKLRSSSGNQSVENIAGPITAKVSSGNIDLTNILENIEAELSSGNLTIDEADGNLSITLSSGDIKLNDIAGSITSKQSSGNTTIKDIVGSLNITTSSGNIKLDSDIANNADWSFKATSGDVDLDIPNDADFNIDINVTSGNIHYGSFNFTGEDTGRNVIGTIGDGNSSNTVKINTTSGDIRFN